MDLFKQIYRYTHLRSYRHNENLWPYMKIGRARSGEINKLEYRGQSVPIADLSSLKVFRAGTLAATGPSVREIDLPNPSPVPAFGVNGSGKSFRAYFLNALRYRRHGIL